MDKELRLLVNLLDSPAEMEYDGMKVHHGFVGAHEVFAAKCGIGKVNAALNTYRIIKAVNPDLVINSGVAGGAGVPIGTLLVADRIAYHDVWCGPGTVYGEADGYPLMFHSDDKVMGIVNALLPGKTVSGLICSGDKFISSAEEIAFIRSKFPEVKAVDMESAAIAQACALTGTPVVIIRVVSDTPGEGENISQYKNFFSEAPEKTFSVIKSIIQAL